MTTTSDTHRSPGAATTSPDPASSSGPSALGPAGTALVVLRSLVGIGSWLSPSATSKVFGIGDLGADPRAAAITRLFGARELGLALGSGHPDPTVRRTALQAGVAIDTVDAIASVVAVRRGAPRITLLTFAAGAVLFAGLGVAALADA